MQPVECAVIAAAGLGSRLGHGLPKCMLEIGGATLLGRLIDTLRPIVPKIHVVVGYREELVIDLVARRYRDVVLVRNPHFRTTNTAESMALGARGCSGKVLFMDGDLLVRPASLAAFVARAAANDLLVGVAPTRSENAVCVRTREDARLVVEGFTRQEALPLEWANVFAGPADTLHDAGNYVFERLAERLPAPAFTLDLREVDTTTDLDHARAFARDLALAGDG